MSQYFSYHCHNFSCPWILCTWMGCLAKDIYAHIVANAKGLFISKPSSWWRSFPIGTLCKVAWSSRWVSPGLPHFIQTVSPKVRVDSRKMTVVSEHRSLGHYPSVDHGTYHNYLRKCRISGCFNIGTNPILTWRFPHV